MPLELLSLNSPSDSLAFSRKVIDKTFYPEKKRVTETSCLFLLDSLEREKANKMLELLEHPELQTLIENGQITIGAIKPRSEESKLGLERDEEAAERILKEVKPPLEITFTITLAPTRIDLENFYPENVQVGMKSRMEDGETVWERFIKYMQRGPVTYFLIYDPTGNAIPEWRRQIGATNPSKAQPDTIRGKFALDIRQNLVHGSSGDTDDEARQNVKNEVAWVRNMLQNLLNQVDTTNESAYPQEDLLREMSLVKSEEEILLASVLARSDEETMVRVFALTTRNSQGETRTTYIAEKEVGEGDIGTEIMSYARGLAFLESKGLATPTFYGINGNIIYHEYLTGSLSSEEVLEKLNRGDLSPEETSSVVAKLAKIAQVLDTTGSNFKGEFLRNLIYSQAQFYFTDGRLDLETQGNSRNEKSLNLLLSLLRDEGLKTLAKNTYYALD